MEQKVLALLTFCQWMTAADQHITLNIGKFIFLIFLYYYYSITMHAFEYTPKTDIELYIKLESTRTLFLLP
jgi:hypothetical protein